MFLLQSSLSYFFLLVVACVMILLALGDPADGIRWLVNKPLEHKNVQQGLPFSLRWHYEMDENETFVASVIGQKEQLDAMASRHRGENMYYKHQRKDNQFFSIFGKKNVTLQIHSAEIGQTITYCCTVLWRIADGKREDRHCFKVFVYALPRITHHIPQLSCKQGDSIKLQCNATGFPTPHVDWIHDDTQELIDTSSDTVLNITGKRSEGIYCCNATNGFGRKNACTAVNVTEYEPENTILSVKQTNKDNVNILHIKCDADASPPSNYFIINIDNKEYNSSYGLKTYKVPSPRKDKREDIAVSCIPCNKYGQGPLKEVVLPLNVPPRFMTPIRTQYNMTVSNMRLECVATGIPTPNIRWTNGDTGDTVGTGKYYQVPYVTCATRTMTFYCHAVNAVGNISSPEIHVNVMTACIFNTTDKGLDKTAQMSSEKLILISCVVVVVVTIVVIFALLVIVCLERKNKPRKEAESTIRIFEDPYQEPLDAVVPGRDGSQSILARSNITSTDDGYTTIKECVLRPRKQNVSIPTKHERHMEDHPYQEPLDAVVLERDGSKSLITRSSTISSDDGYASVEDYLLKPKKQNVCRPMDTKLEENMEDIPYQEPIDAVVPEQDEPQDVATNNATVEECGLKLSRDVNDTLDPMEEDSNYEPLIQLVPP